MWSPIVKCDGGSKQASKQANLKQLVIWGLFLAMHPLQRKHQKGSLFHIFSPTGTKYANKSFTSFCFQINSIYNKYRAYLHTFLFKISAYHHIYIFICALHYKAPCPLCAVLEDMCISHSWNLNVWVKVNYCVMINLTMQSAKSNWLLNSPHFMMLSGNDWEITTVFSCLMHMLCVSNSTDTTLPMHVAIEDTYLYHWELLLYTSWSPNLCQVTVIWVFCAWLVNFAKRKQLRPSSSLCTMHPSRSWVLSRPRSKCGVENTKVQKMWKVLYSAIKTPKLLRRQCWLGLLWMPRRREQRPTELVRHSTFWWCWGRMRAGIPGWMQLGWQISGYGLSCGCSRVLGD